MFNCYGAGLQHGEHARMLNSPRTGMFYKDGAAMQYQDGAGMLYCDGHCDAGVLPNNY